MFSPALGIHVSKHFPSSCYTLNGVDYLYSIRALLQKAKEAGAPQPVGNTLEHLAGELFCAPNRCKIAQSGRRCL